MAGFARGFDEISEDRNRTLLLRLRAALYLITKSDPTAFAIGPLITLLDLLSVVGRVTETD